MDTFNNLVILFQFSFDPNSIASPLYSVLRSPHVQDTSAPYSPRCWVAVSTNIILFYPGSYIYAKWNVTCRVLSCITYRSLMSSFVTSTVPICGDWRFFCQFTNDIFVRPNFLFILSRDFWKTISLANWQEVFELSLVWWSQATCLFVVVTAS